MGLMKMNKLYKELSLKFTEEGYKLADKKSKKIYKQHKRDQEELLDKIAKIILTYTVLDNILSIGSKEKNTLRKEFSNTIDSICLGQFKLEKDVMQDIFETVTKDKYYSSAYTLNLGIDFNLQKIADKQIKEIVNKTIKGELWSDRLWTNKKDLEKSLKVEIERFLQGKTNVNRIEKVVKGKFNQNAFNTKRLVETEVAKCQNEVNDVFAEEHGIEEQIYTATLDNATSKFCREHDGERYKINDLRPSLPAHPFCRSCYINIPFKDWKPKIRKDNITKEYIPYINYKEWLEQQGI